MADCTCFDCELRRLIAKHEPAGFFSVRFYDLDRPFDDNPKVRLSSKVADVGKLLDLAAEAVRHTMQAHGQQPLEGEGNRYIERGQKDQLS